MRFQLPSVRIVSTALGLLLVGLAILPARALENLPYVNNFDSDTVGPSWEDPDFVVYSSYSIAANT